MQRATGLWGVPEHKSFRESTTQRASRDRLPLQKREEWVGHRDPTRALRARPRFQEELVPASCQPADQVAGPRTRVMKRTCSVGSRKLPVN
jgi:hypothetical protein